MAALGRGVVTESEGRGKGERLGADSLLPDPFPRGFAVSLCLVFNEILATKVADV